ncbi:MAG TPA: hypothetical protein VMU12_01645 [Candidatus Paceibacterota bacterium]|nr:hypothetical protein [Candidatus Paceibacterota bacterium]
MQKLVKYSAVIATVAAVLVPTMALALVQPTVPIGNPGQVVTGSSLANLINTVVQYMLTISTVIAVGFIVWGGIQALRGGWASAKGTLLNAVIGLAIIFGVGLLLNTIARLIQTQSIG